MAIVWETTRAAIEGFFEISKSTGQEYTNQEFNTILEQIYISTVGMVSADTFGNKLIPANYSLADNIEKNTASEFSDSAWGKLRSTNNFVQQARYSLAKLISIRIDYTAIIKNVYYEISKDFPNINPDDLYTYITENLSSSNILLLVEDQDSFINMVVSKSNDKFGTPTVGTRLIHQIHKQSIVNNMASRLQKIQEYKTKYQNLISGISTDITNAFQETDTHISLEVPGLVSLKVYKPHYQEYEVMLTDAVIRLATPLLPIQAASATVDMIRSKISMIETMRDEYTYEKLLSKYTGVLFKTVNGYIDSLPEIDISKYVRKLLYVQNDIVELLNTIGSKYATETSSITNKIGSITTDDLDSIDDISDVMNAISALTGIVNVVPDMLSIIYAIYQTKLEEIVNSDERLLLERQIDKVHLAVVEIKGEVSKYLDMLQRILAIQDTILDTIKDKVAEQMTYATDMVKSLQEVPAIDKIQTGLMNGVVTGLNLTWSPSNVECIFTNTLGGVPVRNIITSTTIPLTMDIDSSKCNFVDEILNTFKTHAGSVSGVYYVMVGTPPVLTPFPWTGII